MANNRHFYIPLLLLFFLFFNLTGISAQEKETAAQSFNDPISIIDLAEIISYESGVPFRPYAVRFDNLGRAIVAEKDRKDVLILDKGNLVKNIGKTGTGEGEFLGNIGGIAIDSENRIYAVDTYNHRIQVFGEDGNFLFMFGSLGDEEDEFSRPRGIALDGDGNIYVADAVQNKIKVFDQKGQFLRAFGSSENLKRPEWIAIGETGKIFVVHKAFPCINVYSPEGDFISSFAEQGEGPGEIYDDPEGIALDGEGHIFIADEDEGRIEIYDEEGRYLSSLGKGMGSQAGQMLAPKGIDFDGKNKRLAMADSWNSRIQIFDLKDLIKKEGESHD